ncbi:MULTISPECIES: DNA/RNA non-specific endonuclease [unclassified Psychrobacter]|uniref:DNA/RNA non-specific endonuclease n=1 Tax=unclassified Psychrobacter TaxID=196806 RepID=UPI0025B4A5F0|nr:MULTISPECIES: DNA/RNA non-specific endonuclease [unclassified Psychrobacter]MDN3454014.1 DNA/RNA non-specific endonuclease [Psychrobacter sp. APC 3350]MDN3501826.1 DNA/RNA non-specific endonuclease [Psychrobacter sp. 5A.1]
MTVLIVTMGITQAYADDFTQCSESFYGGVYPEFTNTKLNKEAQALCMDGFAVMYSGVSRTPLWSAEYLDRKRLQQAKQIDREDSFHEESKLPESARASLSDYSKSGYDRGHLAPNANMANRSQQYDSFSLANIAPQSPRNNRYIWRNIESATRYLTQQYGEVYTITGVAFTNKKPKQLANRVIVPSHFFKAVYIPATNQAGVYYAPNDESERIDIISIDELTTEIGIDVLPMLDNQSKSQAFDLPLKAGDSSELPDEPEKEPDWMLFVWAILEWLIAQLQA